MERVKAGQLLGHKIQGYDLPVRKLRMKNESYVVTIPPWFVKWLGIDKGDSIKFDKAKLRGVVKITGIKQSKDNAGCRRGD